MNNSEPLRILIVDDERINIEIIIEAFSDCGFHLMSAVNGEEALIKAREGQPNLILLDIMMPNLDGFGVCAILKSQIATQNIPVIFLTALTTTEQKLRGFQLGGVDYITKPFDPRELLARVNLHIDQHRLQKDLQQRLKAYERAEPSPTSANFLSTEQDPPLHKVRNYLLENLASSLNLDQLARIAATNRTTLNQEFQKHYSMSVFDWLREQRLLKAALLLRTSNESVLDIARNVGYTSHAGFTTSFHQRFGVSPRDYRSSFVV